MTAGNRQATAAEIRAYLGHGDGSRRVRVSRDGRVTYRGSRDPVDRQHDYTHDGGPAASYWVDRDGEVYQ